MWNGTMNRSYICHSGVWEMAVVTSGMALASMATIVPLPDKVESRALIGNTE